MLSQRLDSRLPYAAFSASSESLQLEIDFETFFSTVEGSGIVRLEVGGRLVAAPLPSFRSRGRRDAQICVGRPWLQLGPFAREHPTLWWHMYIQTYLITNILLVSHSTEREIALRTGLTWSHFAILRAA